MCIILISSYKTKTVLKTWTKCKTKNREKLSIFHLVNICCKILANLLSVIFLHFQPTEPPRYFSPFLNKWFLVWKYFRIKKKLQIIQRVLQRVTIYLPSRISFNLYYYTLSQLRNQHWYLTSNWTAYLRVFFFNHSPSPLQGKMGDLMGL